MKKTIVKLILFIAAISIIVKCTDVPLSDNLKTTVPELNGMYEFEDKLRVKFEVTDNETVYFTQYEPDKNGTFVSDDIYNLPVYFTDIKHKGKIHHFISVKYSDKMFESKKIELKNNNILVTSLSDAFISENSIGDFTTPENFKKFIIENMNNPELFEKEKELFKKREL